MGILEQIEEKIGKCPRCGRQVTAIIDYRKDSESDLITRCTKCNIKHATPYDGNMEWLTILSREHLRFWGSLRRKVKDPVKRKNFHKRKRNRGRAFANWRYV